jgi:hypothetical protein
MENAKLGRDAAREFNQKPLPAIDGSSSFAFATQGNTPRASSDRQ